MAGFLWSRKRLSDNSISVNFIERDNFIYFALSSENTGIDCINTLPYFLLFVLLRQYTLKPLRMSGFGLDWAPK